MKYVYVSNESPTLVDVYFDDVTMTYTPSNVIQYSEYYPFQNTTQNSWTRVNAVKNNFLGNGGTELNTNSQFYDLEYRHYDPVLGRMNGVDPMADKYSSLSPYNYSFNMPNMVVDVNGADPYQTVNASATTSPYYIMYTYDDRIDPTGLGAQTICAQCWREGNSGAMAFYGAARGRDFGMSMSFGALPYSAAGRAYAAQMRSDAYGLSTEAYGARYRTSNLGLPLANMIASRLGVELTNYKGSLGFWRQEGLTDAAGVWLRFLSLGPNLMTEGQMYEKMWKMSFDTKGNVVQETSAFLTSTEVLLLPTEGLRQERDESGNQIYGKNGPRVSHWDYVPWRFTDDRKFQIKWKGVWTNVIGYVHTHPNKQTFGPYEVVSDKEVQKFMEIPVILIRTNGFYSVEGIVFGSQKEFFGDNKSMINIIKNEKK